MSKEKSKALAFKCLSKPCFALCQRELQRALPEHKLANYFKLTITVLRPFRLKVRIEKYKN